MGKSCFFIGKKSFISRSKRQKEDEKPNNKSKKRWFIKQKSSDFASLTGETPSTVPLPPPPLPPPPPPEPHLPSISPVSSIENAKEPTEKAVNFTTQDSAKVVPLMESIPLENVEDEKDDEEQRDQIWENNPPEMADVVAVQGTAEVVPVKEFTPLENVKMKEDEEEAIPIVKVAENVPLMDSTAAAIKIQMAYRAYMGRRALRALRELSRLKPSVKGQNVERQATATLRSMQTLARVQSEIRDGRSRMTEEQHKQPNQKSKTPSPAEQTGEDWDVSTKSKEQIEASLLHKKEAAVRRERALAYASSHRQVRKSFSKIPQQTETEMEDPQRGWRLLENWMADRPWETQSREFNTNSDDQKLVKTTAERKRESTTLAAKPQKKTPQLKARKGINNNGGIQGVGDDNDGSRSVLSERSNRRHSSVCVGSSSSVKDDETMSDKNVIKRSQETEKTAKARRASLSAPPGHLTSRKINRDVPEKKRPVGSVKKRLSFSGLPAGTRRLTDPV